VAWRGSLEFGVEIDDGFWELQGCGEYEEQAEDTYLQALFGTHRGGELVTS
jgi:hypothetical protein